MNASHAQEPAGAETLAPLESQHSLLRSRGAELEEVLDAMCSNARIRTKRSDAQWLHDELAKFSEALLSHLEWEEACGVLDGAVKHAPHLSRRASELLAQHDGLRTEMGRILEETLAGAAETEIRTRFHDLRQHLLGHDHAESSLLQKAYLEDLGSGD